MAGDIYAVGGATFFIGSASMAALHGRARSKSETLASHFPARRMRADRGPSNTASGRRKSPKDGPQDAGQFAAGPWMDLRRTPASAREPAAHGWAEGVFAGWPSFW